jgi:hypothetical protein
MSSTSWRDQVNSAPVPAPAPAPAPTPAPVFDPIPAMTAGESEPMSSSDLRYRWLIDSGANFHISNNLSHFTTLDTNPVFCLPVTYGDGISVKASGVGTMRIKGDNGDIITLTGVFWIPTNAMRIFSVKRTSDNNCTTMFQDDRCMIYQDQVLVFHTAKDPHSNYLSNPILVNKNALSLLPPGFSLPASAMVSYVKNESTQIWHARYGHLSYRMLEKLMRKTLMSGMNVDPKDFHESIGGLRLTLILTSVQGLLKPLSSRLP